MSKLVEGKVALIEKSIFVEVQPQVKKSAPRYFHEVVWPQVMPDGKIAYMAQVQLVDRQDSADIRARLGGKTRYELL